MQDEVLGTNPGSGNSSARCAAPRPPAHLKKATTHWHSRLKLYLLLLIILLAYAPAAFSQEARGGVQVQLSLADDKTTYRAGEPIRLILSFTADREGYQLNLTTTKTPSPVDEVLLSPGAGVFRWMEQYSGRHRYYPDYSSLTQLSATPTLVELPLNDWFRFDRPGRYSVRVKTDRVSRPRRPTDMGAPIPLVTNEVSFEVVPMTEADEEREVHRLSALLDATKDWKEEDKITEELSYLTGDASTREKVRRFLSSEGRSGNYMQNVYLGLFIARNRSLVVKLLEAALRDTNAGATHQLLSSLTRLRVLQAEAAQPTATDADKKKAAAQEEQLTSEVQQGYIRELVASLPKRTSESQTTTAMLVLANLPKEKAQAAEVLGKIRGILIQEFDDLHPFSQDYLLRAYWEQLRDPALMPAIERMAQYQGEQGQIVRTIALKRLTEMSPGRARPHLIAEILNPESLADLDVLSALGDETLPEIDKALLEQIRERAPLKRGFDSVHLNHKAQLAARYASAAIYDDLMETYRTWGDKWPADARASLLGYFARHNDKEAMPLIEQALSALAEGQSFSFLLDLTRAHYSDGINAMLQKRLEGEDPEAVSTAAYLMSKYGPPANRQLIEARLERWLGEWKSRAGELDAEGADPKLLTQRMVQVNLIEALMQAKSWKLSSEQTKQLQQSCLTQDCRRRYPVR